MACPLARRWLDPEVPIEREPSVAVAVKVKTVPLSNTAPSFTTVLPERVTAIVPPVGVKMVTV